jgi:hypothetical protein
VILLDSITRLARAYNNVLPVRLPGRFPASRRGGWFSLGLKAGRW